MEEYWKKWFREQTLTDQHRMAFYALSRLMELEEISFRFIDPDEENEEGLTECLYHRSCGESLLED